jgi:hypothetical protein
LPQQPSSFAAANLYRPFERSREISRSSQRTELILRDVRRLSHDKRFLRVGRNDDEKVRSGEGRRLPHGKWSFRSSGRRKGRNEGRFCVPQKAPSPALSRAQGRETMGVYEVNSGSMARVCVISCIASSVGRPVNRSAACNTFGRSVMSPAVFRNTPGRPSTQSTARSIES